MHKVLIVGCGKISGLLSGHKGNKSVESHAQAFKSNEGFELAGCVDSNLERAKKFARTIGIPFSSNILEEAFAIIHPDVVVIATPDDTHFEIAHQVLVDPGWAPRIIFLEKPACTDENELTKLLRLSTERQIPIVVNHSRRFHPLYHRLRAAIDTGQLGELRRIDTVYYGGWCHNAVHLVDIIRYVSRMELEELEVLEKIEDGRQIDPTYTVRGVLGPQKIPVWFHGWDENYYQIFDLDFRFDTCRCRVGNFEQMVNWEEVSLNSLGEKILLERPDRSIDNSEEPLVRAVSGIRRYLDDHEVDGLCQSLLKDIAPTMRSLWEVRSQRSRL